MPNTIDSLFARLDAAMKAITTGELGESILTPEKFARFVRVAAARSPILDSARFIRMQSHTTEIDRISFTERVLHPAPSEGAEITDTTDPARFTNKLISVKLVGVTELTDEALEDNIEQAGFEDTLVALIAERAGLDLEELFLNGDTDLEEDDYLELTDGWLKLAANKIEGDADPGSGEFDQSDPEALFQGLIEAIPKKLLTSRRRDEWRIYVPFETEDHYRDVLRDKGTDLGDLAQTGATRLSYKGIQVVDVPNMPADAALLTHPNNTVWGLWRDIRVERERKARFGRTDFITTLRGDCHYEDENAAVSATGYVGPS